MEKLSLDPRSLNTSVQNLPVNLGSLSLMMVRGMPYYFTSSFTNHLAASSAVLLVGAGVKMA